MSKRTKWLLSIGFIAALVVGFQVAAYATHYEATLEGSNFEIDNNANLRDDTGNTLIDWANLAHPNGPEFRVTDKPTGQQDDSYAGGTKANTECPEQVTGSIPNNKSDLLTFHTYTEPGVGGHPGFLNLAWSRVSDPSGTTLMDFELNQSRTRCPSPSSDPNDPRRSPNMVRTDGDILIEYAIDQGGARADIKARVWDTNGTATHDDDAWGPPIDVSDASTVCGGNPCAVGTINNTDDLPATESDGLGLKKVRTFGEAQLDLRFLLANATNGCVGFGSAMLKSRSSDKITPQLKDFIVPATIEVSNCGELKIVKTAKDASAASGTAPLNGATFEVKDSQGTVVATPTTSGTGAAAGTACVSNLTPGATYTVTEKTAPANYQKDNASVTRTIAAGDTCASADASNTASFVNSPLSSIQVKFTSLAGTGKTRASISCSDSSGPITDAARTTEQGNADTATPPANFDDTDETFTGLVPGTTANPAVYTCTIRVDP